MKLSTKKIILITFLLIVTIIVISLLGIWTSYISKRNRQEVLKKALLEIVNEGGEKAIFEAAGLDPDEIYYSSDRIRLYPSGDDKGAWRYTQEEARRISVFEKCKDCVVQIKILSEFSDSGQGSGVIITSDGYILTNSHVVLDSERVNVNFYNGDSQVARVVGVDPLSDIAIIKVDGLKALNAVEFAEDDPVVGETALAIGNPFGYTWSLTSGLVSGLGRTVYTQSGNVIPNLIQTDAMINPGNSGGPLLDGEGKMIGLISSIYSSSGQAEGVSFALDNNTIRSVSNELITSGKINRGWIDALTVQLNPQIVDYLNLPVDEGILISQVLPAGKADRSGLRGGSERAQYGQSVIYLGGDVILEINGERIRDYSDYFSALFSTKSGDKVDLTVLRNGNQIKLSGVELVEQTEENVKWILR